jgi:hypothetical protein
MITYQAGIRPFNEDDMSSTVNTPNSMNPPRSNGTVNNIPPKETKPANINFDDGEGDANPKPINPAGNVASTVNMVKPSAPTNTNNTPSNNIANPANQMNNNPNKRAVGEEVMTKEFKQIVSEYMDITDYKTNTRLYNLDEAEQNTVLLSLTNKLYQMIVAKIDDVEKGDIPKSRGDITRLPKYNQLKECAKTLTSIFEQYKEDTAPIKVIENAIDNLEDNSDVFVQSYMAKVDFGIMIYESVTLAVIGSLSYMIACCIEYVKDPKNDGLTIVMDKTGVAKVKEHLLYENLVKFNEACRTNDIENALRPLIKNRTQNLFGVGGLVLVKGLLIAVPVIIALIPLVKDLVYYFFAARQRVSVYFDIQADLLEMNANELKDNPNITTDADRKSVIRKQLQVARTFRQIADKLAVEAKTAENKADKEIKKDNKKYRIDDVETNPADASDGPLF